jgi:tetrathionate reductase subunit B
MNEKAKLSTQARRAFLGKLGLAATCTGAAIGAGVLGAVQTAAAKGEGSASGVKSPTASSDGKAGAAAGGGSFPTPDYDWTKHQWAFGVDANKCIGCLRCAEACKRENQVPGNAHQFRTWVERYVYLEGDEKVHIDSQQDPVNIEASGSEREYRFANRYKDEKVEKAFFVPKLCNHCTHPACVQVCPTGATYRTKDGVVLIDHEYCIGCRYCVQACPYGARYFDEERGVSDKCTWCYHRITKGLDPACVEVCPVGARVFGDTRDKESPISLFIRNNRVQVLRPESGNAPNVFYVGIDKEVN